MRMQQPAPVRATAPAPDTKTAVVLVNLGTPDAPTAAAVRRYLGEFLMDRRVVALSRLIWWPLLNFVILPLRSPRVAKLYAGVWMDEGSPLAAYTARLARGLQARLPQWRVVYAMRYQNPSLARTLETLRAQGATQIFVLPLYPQFSTTTTASVNDVATRIEGTQVLQDYHLDPAWIAAIADSIRAHWQKNGQGERLLFSFHGIPQRLNDAGDPYRRQCEASTAAIIEALGVDPSLALLTFQSRFGREPWLQPYTDKTLEGLAASGVRTVDVVCPGFAVDCLETLEEIALQNAEIFGEQGGEALRYIPCLNDSAAHVEVMAGLIERELRADA